MGALWAVKEQRGARGARTVSVRMLTWRYKGNIRSCKYVDTVSVVQDRIGYVALLCWLAFENSRCR
jgi:hypothetical protein